VKWLERQENKSAAIRHAIRQAIQHQSMKQAVRDVIQEELRQAELTVTSADDADAHEASSAITEDVDPEAGQRLDNLF
jgi:Arc/MetJ-type ribon-helix-helix transcriptional regulator